MLHLGPMLHGSGCPRISVSALLHYGVAHLASGQASQRYIGILGYGVILDLHVCTVVFAD